MMAAADRPLSQLEATSNPRAEARRSPRPPQKRIFLVDDRPLGDYAARPVNFPSMSVRNFGVKTGRLEGWKAGPSPRTMAPVTPLLPFPVFPDPGPNLRGLNAPPPLVPSAFKSGGRPLKDAVENSWSFGHTPLAPAEARRAKGFASLILPR